MKKKLGLMALLIINMANAQLSISPNPATINSGQITITYGASADYSLYNPQSNPTLYLYTGLETDGVASTWEYHDKWTDLSTLVPLTWNATAQAYVATVNIKTRSYIQESSQTSMTLPNGTTVNDWYFIITNGNVNSKSADLKGSTYGFAQGTLSNNSFETKNIAFSIADGKMQTNVQGKSQLEIYALDGKRLSSIDFENDSNSIEIAINLNQKGVFIAQLTSEGLTKAVKFFN